MSSFDRVYVNLIGVMQLSSVARIIRRTPHCRIVQPLARAEVNCVADVTDEQLAILEYTEQLVNHNLRKLADKYNHFTPRHAVVFHDLFAEHPVPDATWLAVMDCIHPSDLAHNASGTLLWNSMFSQNRSGLKPERFPTPVCPDASSTFFSGSLGGFFLANTMHDTRDMSVVAQWLQATHWSSIFRSAHATFPTTLFVFTMAMAFAFLASIRCFTRRRLQKQQLTQEPL